MNKRQLESELEECGKLAENVLDRLNSPDLTASEYDQRLAEYNSYLLRYNKIETELLLIGVSPSKRTKRMESILRERMRT